MQVLLLEDEALVAMDVTDMLIDAGMDVIVTARIGDAREIIGSGRRIDLAVLDINVAGETSYAVAGELTLRGIPFVFMSGYRASQPTVPAEFAAHEFLPKPVDASMLVRTIGEVQTKHARGARRGCS